MSYKDDLAEAAYIKANPLRSSKTFSSVKDYYQGRPNELINCLKFVEPQSSRYTYNYKGSKTALDHVLIPYQWEADVDTVVIDHKSSTKSSDHWPMIVSLSP